VVFNDDFSEKNTKAWDCEDCRWEDGALLVGPYRVKRDTSEQAHSIVCKICGEATYYRIAVDATFAEGYTDRLYGLLVGEGKSTKPFWEFPRCKLPSSPGRKVSVIGIC
jgi:hypothetical protein